MIICSILCGGSGERLWPATSKTNPKQFLPLFGNESLFDYTLKRANQISDKIITVSADIHEPQIKKSLLKNKIDVSMILEEVGRNTTAAIWFSAKKALEIDEDSKILIMPSDHYIPDIKGFKGCITDSINLTEKSNWVIFGIKPYQPNTNYGYIKTKKIKKRYEFISFQEKPSYKDAQSFLEKGTYFWNSGIFFARTKNVLNSISLNAPDIYESCENAWKKSLRNNNIILRKEDCERIKNQSIDYAVLEKEKKIHFKEMRTGWKDLGTWDALAELKEINFMQDRKNIIEYECKNNIIFTDNNKIGCFGVKDLIIVSKDNKTMIFKKNSTHNIRKIKEYFDKLKEV